MSLGALGTATILGWVIAFTFAAFALVVLMNIYTNKIDLTYLLSEGGANNKASLSRFQMLLFTYVVAGLYLVLCIESGTLVEIPNGVLGLLGISAGSYVVSKGIGSNATANPPATPAGGAANNANNAGQPNI